MLPFLAAATLLAGYGSSAGVGYQPGPQLAASLSAGPVRVEGLVDLAHKLETNDGWQGDVSGEIGRTLSIGARYTHVHTSRWDKGGPWLRVACRRRRVALLAEVATGRNRERKLEARVGDCWRGACVESRWFVERHLQGTGAGVAVLIGTELRRTR